MSAIPSRLTAVTLGARDLPRLRRFYLALGWQEVHGSGDGWASFLLGGVLLALYPVDELATEAVAEVPSASEWSGITLGCNVDSREQVDSVYAAAVAAGATAVADPVDRPWGGRSGYIADPEGTRWEIAWAPSVRFDSRGALLSFGD